MRRRADSAAGGTPGGWLRLKREPYILQVSYFWYIDVSSTLKNRESTGRRIRLSREQRLSQLLEVARWLVRDEGTDALTLPRLAEQAGVAKPVVYDHFRTRNGLLTALYQDFDARQTALIDAALEGSASVLEEKASVIASSYVECVLAQGREIPGVLAALAGSPELETVKRDYQLDFIERCRKALAPFTGPRGIMQAGFWAMLGAADTLSHAAATGEITAQQARDELYETIVAMIERSNR
ncbi:MAG: TetR/AcrR family transcriptional regulator [Mesorhizobium sp.]|nr:TetR/AcrR family transcriptional regulator [Mesorhizobium sp. M5C.F.Cr.IN.023.01.1.1]RWF85462.1 MAG: TetR/AcrR family transcriptional regulator [Mesorhizobium sp.]RWF93458.1 MAG: TetR/AcrR family transcriptional regulator [Mesorhizobium sp.]RWI34631.1 MAG: TetR/AcrR family transcriptional regulator [Mesorhizobium sp.]RWI45634.1 MAG: TetR/AcrR family transcriptional regulator [Mesorhizobium sp.]